MRFSGSFVVSVNGWMVWSTSSLNRLGRLIWGAESAQARQRAKCGSVSHVHRLCGCPVSSGSLPSQDHLPAACIECVRTTV